MGLKDDILSAYGTCDYFKGETKVDLRPELNAELIQYVYLCTDSRPETIEFIKQYLLYEGSAETQLELALKQMPQNSAGKFHSSLLEDFNWVDELLNSWDQSFGRKNALLLDRIYEKLTEQYSHQGFKTIELVENLQEEKEALEEEKSARLSELLEELDALTGLQGVKEEIKKQIALIQISKLRKARGLKAPKIGLHLLFLGNPGTGKTTVARLLGQIYKELGVLSKGQMVETDRSGLVAGYVGQTAEKTNAMINKALGGILFIDEAYALYKESKNDFGAEAIETLLKAMEDHRDDFMVIAAGYPGPMETFLQSNPGLKSRFNTAIDFENYNAEELFSILLQMAEQSEYIIADDAKQAVRETIEKTLANPPADFANARTIRNYLEKAIARQAVRIMNAQKPEEQDLQILEKEDFPATLL